MALLMAFTVLILAGVIGLAVDGGRAYAVHTQTRNAVDAATLAAARAIAINPDANITEVYNRFVEVATNKHNSRLLSATIVRDGNSVIGTLDVEVPTTFMGILGQDKVAFQVMSKAEFGYNGIEMVLALDTTGSMSGAKIDAMKDAARTLVNTLSAASPSPDKFRVGLVPFSDYVNVGMAYRNESWLDVPLDSTSTVTQCYDTYPNATSSNCRTETGTCYSDGTPYSCSYQVCDWNYGTPVNTCGPVTTTTTWNGCVRSRATPLNLQDGSYSTRIPGQMNAMCPAPLTPLTEDISTVRTAIDGMFAAGNTYIPEGLTWGWRLLSPKIPFGESRSESEANVKRFLVLMTDGANTLSPTDTGHNGGDTALANQFTAEACTAIKADGITIFTIAFEVTDPSIKSILSACASNPGYFYDATNSSQLMASFDAIGRSVQSIRVAE